MQNVLKETFALKSWQNLQNIWLHVSPCKHVVIIYSVGLIYDKIAFIKGARRTRALSF